MNPIYIKGHLSFTLENQNIEYIHQNLSVYGVSGLPWNQLDPNQHFGQRVQVSVKIPGAEPMAFQTPARITREFSLSQRKMGLAFELTQDQRDQLIALIRKSGFLPTDHIRKYPRIPSTELIRTFPLRSIVIPTRRAATGETVTLAQPMVFDVENLSPNGVLLKTENTAASELMPGDHVSITLEPRGWFPTPIIAEGTLCRILDEVHSRTGNTVRRIGIKIIQINELNRQAFMDLMKDILASLKQNA